MSLFLATFHTGFPDYPPSVEFSIASHELRELIQSLLQQLRAEYEAAAALCPPDLGGFAELQGVWTAHSR